MPWLDEVEPRRVWISTRDAEARGISDDDEVLVFEGTNSKDIFDMNAEISVEIGEEREELIINEPSWVAIEKRSRRPLAIGAEAKEMVKLPLVLESHTQWQAAVLQGVLRREELEKITKKEKESIRPIALLQAEQEAINNYFILALHKLCPPIMKTILDLGEVRLNGIICPGHVSAIIGSHPYESSPRTTGLPAWSPDSSRWTFCRAC
jgi:hypothetical protein